MLDILRYLRHNIPTIRAIYLAKHRPHGQRGGFILAVSPRLVGSVLMAKRLLVCRNIQPERLNAEGGARVLLAGGCANA